MVAMNWDRGAGVLPTTHRRMTAEEYFRLPEGPPYFQLIDGELFMSPSPNFFHQEVVGNIYAAIRNYLRSVSLGKVILAPSDVHFDGGNVYQPDVFYIRNERLGIVDEHGAKGAPDLVIEVISGSTGRLDLGPKKTVYAQRGVVEYWVVLPLTSEVEVYRFAESADAPVERLKTGETLTTPLLPGFELPVAEIFAR
jgi:Uma2 family endonuclease